MRHADAGAGLHRDDRLNRHRQVNDSAVTLLVAQRFQAIGETANTLIELKVSDLGDLATVGFENDRNFVFGRRAEMAVEAVVRGVQFAVGEPFEKRCIAVVERLSERLGPDQVFAREVAPEAGVILLGLGTHGRVICGFDVGLGRELGRRRKHTILNKNRFDGR